MDALKLVKKHVAELAEHFDSVQIFVTKVNPTPGERSTAAITYGSGDQYARMGICDTWLRRHREDKLSRDPEVS